MGPCVRLIRALGAQPQPRPELTEEESRKRWAKFKDTVKEQGWDLKEAIISPWNQVGNEDAGCKVEKCCKGRVGPMTPYIEDENTVAGLCTITQSDGTKEEAQVVHNRRGEPDFWGVDTTIVIPTKEITMYSVWSRADPVWHTSGTSITTDADGTRWLGAINGGLYIA